MSKSHSKEPPPCSIHCIARLVQICPISSQQPGTTELPRKRSPAQGSTRLVLGKSRALATSSLGSSWRKSAEAVTMREFHLPWKSHLCLFFRTTKSKHALKSGMLQQLEQTFRPLLTQTQVYAMIYQPFLRIVLRIFWQHRQYRFTAISQGDLQRREEVNQLSSQLDSNQARTQQNDLHQNGSNKKNKDGKIFKKKKK